jgi:vancomycin permeability regulator SanA
MERQLWRAAPAWVSAQWLRLRRVPGGAGHIRWVLQLARGWRPRGRVRTWLALLLAAAGLLGAGYVFAVNAYVEREGARYIVDAAHAPTAEAILVLGAKVLPGGGVSDMLGDRLKVGLQLYEAGRSDRILVSGDHGRQDYDEVNTMKSYLKERGIPGDCIFMDHAGFSTYESMYRARDIFQVHKVIIVTQRYPLMRAIYEARRGIKILYGSTYGGRNRRIWGR